MARQLHMVARHHTPRLVAVLLLVAATLAGAAHAADSLSEGGAALEHHQVQGGQHPDAHVDGFVLRSAFIRVSGSDGSESIHRRMIQFDEQPHLNPDLDPPDLDTLGAAKGRRLLQTQLPSFDATKNSRERVITLAKLNLLAYDRLNLATYEEDMYSRPVTAHFMKNGGSIFSSAVKTAQEDFDASETMFELIKAELDATVKSTTVEYPSKTSKMKYFPGTQIDSESGHVDPKRAGVAALEFKRWSTIPGQSITVLAFRGTRGGGDNENIMNWVHDFVTNSGMTTRMKEIWKDEAKLEWTPEMDERSKKWTFFSSAATCIYHNLVLGSNNAGGYHAEMTKQNNDYTLSKTDYDKTGYWGVTKQLVDKTYVDLNKDKPGTTNTSSAVLLFTGHSQGGTRAALASMYMKKKYGVEVQTTTFAATGPQCVARLLHSDADLKVDVDPYVNHPQIIEYTHYLDPWGQALGREVGNVCLYGKTGLKDSEAKKQCEKAWGTPGILLWFNEGADVLGWKDTNMQNKQLDLDFQNCRYRTHFMDKMILDLQNSTFLKEDGTTDGGCSLDTIVPPDDPDNKCALRDSPCTKHIIAFSFMIGGAFLCVCCCCCAICSRICCPPKGKPPRPPPPPECYFYRGGPVPYFGEKPKAQPAPKPQYQQIQMVQQLPTLGPLIVEAPASPLMTATMPVSPYDPGQSVVYTMQPALNTSPGGPIYYR